MNVYQYVAYHHPTGHAFMRECVADNELAFLRQLNTWNSVQIGRWLYYSTGVVFVRVASKSDLDKIKPRLEWSGETAHAL